MKKTVIKHAKTAQNSIAFFSERHKGYAAVSTIDDDGEIVARFVDVKKEEIPFIVSIITYVAVFLLSANNYTIWLIRFIYAIIVISLTISMSLFVTKSKTRLIWDLRGLHGAEHTVLNAYSKLGRVPTVEEASRFSRFHNYCGTNTTLSDIIAAIITIIVSFQTTSWTRAIIVIIIPIIMNLLAKTGIFNFVQFITTDKPCKKELEVAIAGVKLWDEKEKQEQPVTYDDLKMMLKDMHNQYKKERHKEMLPKE